MSQSTSEWLSKQLDRYANPYQYTTMTDRSFRAKEAVRIKAKAKASIEARIAAERAAEYNLRPTQVREAMLRLYASTTGHTYESVKDEYLGKPLPGAHDIVSNKLYMQIESAVHFALADPQSKPKEKEES